MTAHSDRQVRMTFSCVDSHKFTLDINPADLTTAQEKGVRILTIKGKPMPMFYKKAKAKQNEKMLETALKPHLIETIKNDGDTCVELYLRYCFPHASGTPKWKKNCLTFMTQRPDADNLSKAIVDVMTRLGFWHDDSMVNFHFIKYRCPSPHISVEIKVWKQERNIQNDVVYV